MATLDAVSPLSSIADTAGAAPSDTSATAPPSVTINDPIMDVRLLASLPANLGQNMDVSA